MKLWIPGTLIQCFRPEPECGQRSAVVSRIRMRPKLFREPCGEHQRNQVSIWEGLRAALPFFIRGHHLTIVDSSLANG
jgi:hypothetical protein